MPRRQEAVHSEIKRLSLYAGNTVPDEIVNQLGMRYAIDSPTIARMALAQSAAKESKRREKAKKGQRFTRRLLIAALVRELANDDALRVEAARFYLKHIEFFSDEKGARRLKLGLNVDAE